jgi:hypothetical protein
VSLTKMRLVQEPVGVKRFPRVLSEVDCYLWLSGREESVVRRAFVPGQGSQNSCLNIAVTCPITSASMPFLNSQVLNELPE